MESFDRKNEELKRQIESILAQPRKEDIPRLVHLLCVRQKLINEYRKKKK